MPGTRTATKPDLDLDLGLDSLNLDPEAGKQLPSTARKADVASPDLKKATADKTRARTADIDVGPQGLRHMMDLAGNLDKIDTSDEDDIDVGHGDIDQIPTTPENLPAVVNKEIMAHGQVEPEWHMVKNLPGYLATPIRAMGRQVFKPFTDTPIEEINVLANLMGQGPNENRELNAVAGWARAHGVEIVDAEIQFQELMPDYEADIKAYRAGGYVFFLVQDFAGNYIYSWPEDQSLLT